MHYTGDNHVARILSKQGAAPMSKPKMQELIGAGLFGRGLIEINSLLLIARYNKCLAEIGLGETKLESFKIDKMGWSPEIAAEFGKEYYLSHGDANPFAIILTPEQAYAPIYYPYHSYDWVVIESWFTTYATQISALTKSGALWIDIDQDVVMYKVPGDLLMVHEVVLKTHSTNGTIGEAIRQKDLFRRFLSESESHLDTKLIEDIKKSKERVGDLRKTNCIIRDYQFADVADFYSRVLGGVFVLRSHGGSPHIITRDTIWSDTSGVAHASSDALKVLVEQGYVSCDFAWWKKHISYLSIIAESFLMDVLDVEEPDLAFLKESPARRKGIVQKHAEKLDSYLTLLRIIDAINHDTKPEAIPEHLSMHLLHPSDHLSQNSREVVEHLLSHLREGRLVQMFYRYQKTAFVKMYTKKWNTPRRDWALTRIREHYDRLVRIQQTQAA
jgi:hypothetical protein